MGGEGSLSTLTSNLPAARLPPPIPFFTPSRAVQHVPVPLQRHVYKASVCGMLFGGGHPYFKAVCRRCWVVGRGRKEGRRKGGAGKKVFWGNKYGLRNFFEEMGIEVHEAEREWKVNTKVREG